MISPEILGRYPFIGSLTDAQLKASAKVGDELSVGTSTMICEEGRPAEALYFLLEKALSLYYTPEEEFHPETRKDFLVGEINPSEIFPISAIIEPYIYSATVKAEKECRALKFDALELKKLIDKDPKLYCKLVREIAKSAMERLAFTQVQLAAAWAK